MTKLFLSLHVVAGILFIGPVTVAVSLFPRYARLAADPIGRASAWPVLRLLRRISVLYAVFGISVPVLGLVTATTLGVLGDAWVLVSIALTLAAGLLLALRILPAQDALLQTLDSVTAASQRLARVSGAFALLWVVVVVLMIVRPGSTTGA